MSRKQPIQALTVATPPIHLKSEVFQPAGRPFENLGLARSAQPEANEIHVIVQFDAPPTVEQVALLSSQGVRLLGYIPQHAYFASVPSSLREEVLGRLPIGWLGLIYPADKLPRRMQSGGIGRWALGPDGTADLRVKCFEDVSAEVCRTRLESLGGRVLAVAAELRQWTVNLPTAKLADLLALECVRWVEEVPPPAVPLLDQVRTNTQAALVQELPYNLSGAGVAAGIWDIGWVDHLHPDLVGRVVIAQASSSEGVRNHATHVAGILGGNGMSSASFGGYDRQWRGIAPAVQIYSWDTTDAIKQFLGAISLLHIVVSQNSWGISVDKFFGNCDLYGDYSSQAPEYDQVVTGLYGGRVSVVFAAGNARFSGAFNACDVGPYFTIAPPATAKDILAVGAIYSDTSDMTTFSSWGPVDDGRLKPDLVAPGSQTDGDFGVTSTKLGGGYATLSGTSMSAPAVSGAVVLLVEDHRARFNGQDPLPSTVKGLLLHTAADMVGGAFGLAKGPDYASGYGCLQIKDAVDQLRSDGFLVGQVEQEQTNSYTLVVPERSPEVRVTLVWDDPAGTENAAMALVNDLDLRVYDPAGLRHYPWTLDPDHPAAPAVRTREDHLNVVEQVEVDSEVRGGNWTVQVVGRNVPVKAPQKFTLVFSPPSIPARAIVSLDGSAFQDSPAGNGNGVLDPGETINETLTMRNSDGPMAARITGHLSTDTPGVRILQGDSAYPDLPPGSRGASSAPFVYRLSKTIACGSTITFRHVATSGETHWTNFFDHTVGLLGITNLATNVFVGLGLPRPIPDNGTLNAALPISVPGIILGATVSVRIDHPWVDDLRLDLLAPDGGKVALVKANSLSGADFGHGTCFDASAFTMFDDQASVAIRSGTAPFAGSYRPETPLASLVGRSLAGEWRLAVADTAPADAGTLLCWRLGIAYQEQGYICRVFNRPPVPRDQVVIVVYGAPTRVVLGGTDPDEDPLSFRVQSPPEHGSLALLDPSTGEATYTPAAGYSGPDHFMFVVNDGYDTSETGVVQLVVQPPRAELAIVSIDRPNPVALGREFFYTVTVTNQGPNSGTVASLVNRLPGSVEIVSASSSQGVVTTQPGSIRCELGEIPPSGTAWLRVVAKPSAVGPIPIEAAISGAEQDSNIADNSATSVTLVSYEANLELSGTVTPSPVLAGNPVTVQLAVTNRGPHQATQVRLTQALAAGMEVVSVALSQGAVVLGDRLISCDLGTLDVDAGATVTVRVVPALGGVSTNAASVRAEEVDLNLADNAVGLELTVTPAANLGLTQTVSPVPAAFGHDLTYVLVVTNQGPSPATGIALTNTPPPGCRFLTAEVTRGAWAWDGATLTARVGELPPGSAFRLSFVVVPEVLSALTNSATVSANETDIDPSDNRLVTVQSVIPVADLGVATPGAPALAGLGSQVTYALALTNRGPNVATSVRLLDRLPPGATLVSVETPQGAFSAADGLVTVDVGEMAVGGSLTVRLIASLTQLGTVTNVAELSAAETDLSLEDNRAETVTEVKIAADLTLQAAGAPNPVVLGTPLLYSVTVSNQGPQRATGVVVSNQLPAEVTFESAAMSQGATQFALGVLQWSVGELEVGGAAQLTVTVRATEAGLLTNWVTVAGVEADLELANNRVAVVGSSQRSAELGVTMVGPAAPVSFGAVFSYALVVTNAGPHNATEVRLRDVSPLGLEFVAGVLSQGTLTNDNGVLVMDLGEVAPGVSVEVGITARARRLGEITNTVTLQAKELDFEQGNNQATAVVTVAPTADLGLTSLANADRVALNERLTYSFLVINQGPNQATGVRLVDELPGDADFVAVETSQGTGAVAGGRLTVDLGELAPAARATVKVVVIPRQLVTLTNAVTLGGVETDLNPADNRVVITTVVKRGTDLALQAASPQDPVVVGSNWVYALTLTNLGPNAASGIVVTNSLSAKVVFVSGEMTQGTIQPDPAGLRWEVGALGVGGGAALQVTVRAVDAGQVTNRALLVADEVELDPANNQAVVVAEARREAELAVTLQGPAGPVVFGSVFNYSGAVMNAGPHSATGVRLTDVWPRGLEFVSAIVDQGTITNDNGVLILGIGGIAAGQRVSFGMAARGKQLGAITNQVAVVGAELDFAPSDNAATTVLTITPGADVAIRTLGVPEFMARNQSSTYGFLVTNQGPNRATGVRLVDPLPASLSLVSAETSQGASFVSGNTVAVEVGELEAGAGAVVRVVAIPTQVGMVTNTPTVGALETDLDLSNNSLSVTTLVKVDTDLAVTATGVPDPVVVGESVTFTVVATNQGPNVATGVLVTNLLPAEVALDLVQASQGTTQSFPGMVRWDAGSLAAGDGARLVLRVRVVEAGLLSDRVTIAGEQLDLVPANNTAVVALRARHEADLGVTLSGPATSPLSGATFSFGIVVTNGGPHAATGVRLTDALPSGLEFVAAALSQGSAAHEDGVLRLDLGEIRPGGRVKASITARALFVGEVTNRVLVIADEVDPNPANNEATIILTALVTGMNLVLPVNGGRLESWTSQYNDAAWGASRLTDGVKAGVGGSWASAARPAGPQGFEYSFRDGGVGRLDWAVLYNFGESAESYSKSVEFYASWDRAHWVFVTNGVLVGVEGPQVFELGGAKAPYLKVVVTEGYGREFWELGEVEVYGSLLPDANILLPGNGGRLESWTTEYNDSSWAASRLTDGVKGGVGGSWASAARPAGPQGFEYSFRDGGVGRLDWAVVYNFGESAESYSKSVEFYASWDRAHWVFVTNGVLVAVEGPQVFELGGARAPYLKVVVMEGYGREFWELGEVEVYGSLLPDTNILLPGNGGRLESWTTEYNDSSWAASRLTDGVKGGVGGSWASAARPSGPQAFEYSLAGQRAARLGWAVVYNYGESATDYARGLEFYVSSDRAQWVFVTNAVLAALAGPQVFELGGASGPYVRVVVTDGYGGDYWELGEVELYGTLLPTANLGAASLAPALSAVPGRDFAYTVVVTNRGPDAATGVRVVDRLPVASDLVSVTVSQGTAQVDGGEVRVQLGELTAGSRLELKLVVRPQVLGTLTNSVSVTANEIDPDPADNTDTSVVPVVPGADLSLTMTSTADAMGVGGRVRYLLSVSNNGPGGATGVALVDTLPVGATLQSARVDRGTWQQDNGAVHWQLDDLPAGARASLALELQVGAAGTLTNSAVVAGKEFDPDLLNNSAYALLAAEVVTDLLLPVNGGRLERWSSQYNDSTWGASHLTDGVPGGVGGSWASAAQPAEPQAFEYSFRDGGVARMDWAVVHNYGESAEDYSKELEFLVSWDRAHWVLVTNGVLAATVGPQRLELGGAKGRYLKVVVTDGYGRDYWELGEVEVYGAVLPERNLLLPANGGRLESWTSQYNDSTWAASHLTDGVPGGVGGSWASAARPAEPQTFEYSFRDLTAARLGWAIVYNFGESAEAYSREVEFHGSLDRTNWSLLARGVLTAEAVPQLFDLGGTKGQYLKVVVISGYGQQYWELGEVEVYGTALPQIGQAADLGLGLSGTAAARIGDVLRYVLTVTNRGPDVATSVLLTNALPGGVGFRSAQVTQGAWTQQEGRFLWQLGDLAAGTNASATVEVDVRSAGTLTNSASVAANEFDPNLLNNAATLLTVVSLEADVAVSLLGPPEPVLVGKSTAYSFTVTNRGPNPALGVSLLHALATNVSLVSVQPSQGTFENLKGVIRCQFGTLSPGAAATVTLAVTPQVPGPWPNLATVTALGADPDLANNTVVASTVARNQADLTLVVAGSPAPVLLGEPWLCTLQITNWGPHPATLVRLTDTLPAGVGIVSVEVSQGGFTTNNGTVIFDLGGLGVGASATARIRILAAQAGVLTNQAAVVAAEFDSNTNDNAALLTAVVVPQADLSLSLVAPFGVVVTGSEMNLSLQVANHGPAAATGVSLSLPLPVGLDFVSASASRGNAQIDGRAFSYQVGALAPGEGMMVTLVLRASAAGSYLLLAAASANEADLQPGDNQVFAAVSVMNVAEVAISRQALGQAALLGTEVSWQFSVTNRGPQAASEVVLDDSLPAGFSYISGAATQGAVVQADGQVTATVGKLEAGQGAEVTLVLVPAIAGVFTNTASVRSTALDPNPVNNSTSAVVSVYPTPRLEINLQATPNVALLGNKATFSVVVTNRGGTLAPQVLLLAAFTSDAELETAVVTRGTADTLGPGVSCVLGDLPPGAGATLTVVARPKTLGELICQATLFVVAPTLVDLKVSGRLAVSVLDTPALGWQRASGNRFILSWPSAANDLLLEYKDDLAVREWLELRATRVIDGDQVTVTLKPAGAGRFYRLRKP